MAENAEDAEDSTESFSDEEVKAGSDAVKKLIDEAGYGNFVTEAQCQQFSRAVLDAVADYRNDDA